MRSLSLNSLVAASYSSSSNILPAAAEVAASAYQFVGVAVVIVVADDPTLVLISYF